MANNNERRGRWQGFDLGGGGSSGEPRKMRTSPWVWVLGFLVVLVLFNYIAAPRPKEILYTEFLDHVEAGRIVGTVDISTTTVSGEFQDASGDPVTFTADIPPTLVGTTQPTDRLDENGVAYTGAPPNGFQTFLIGWVAPLLLFGLLWFFLIRRMSGAQAGAALNLGRNKVKIYDRKEMKTTFADVAGVDEAKDELKEIVEFLSNPKKYQRLGGRIPKGVLLLGPPGCGKTLLARAVAGEANVPFFFMSGSEFVEMFVGLGAARMRDLFQQAKEKAPALVFLDEIDTIGKGRAGALGAGFGGHDEREQTLNQLLVEMDGFDASKGVIIMAATNRPDVLDPALVRPGRFDRQVVVDQPDLKGRQEILRVHVRGVAIDPSVELRILAARTPGFTGADLANVVNEAALLAARKEKDSVTMVELEEAIDRVIAGPERKTRILSEDERTTIAYHETGHALVGYALPNSDPVHKITIVSRGRSLGHTLALPTHDKYLSKRSELVDRLAMLLGGRTAEELIYADPSTGAADDIEKATTIARRMVMEYGMSDELGPMQYGRPNGEVFLGRDYSRQQDYSDQVAAFIDAEVRKMITAAHLEARTILEHHADALERMVAALLEKETVDRGEVAEIFGDVPKWEHALDGSLRIKYPDEPVLPQVQEDIAAAVAKKEPEEVTESLQLDRKLPRTKGRPAEA
jgi:cell division protease FtsH